MNNDKLKNGNSLETQFWNEDVEVDLDSPLFKFIHKIDKLNKDYTPSKEEKEQLKKDMQEYYKNSTQK